ncbi:THO complex subunit-like protein [Euroglyphus maynei]|uniref:THO complex subunit-like protein n=1 Tax=Euroglyphus maynei TaxID=6958 RepID=A0A1Y3AX84_EURMA|nr:THO complex subunit-like protein [Euroglyphus maynei]
MDTEASSKIDMSLDEIIRMDRIRGPRKFAGGGSMGGGRMNRNRQNNLNRNSGNYRNTQRFNYRSFNNGGRNNYNQNMPKRPSNFQQNRSRPLNFDRNRSSYQSGTLHIANLAPNVTTEDLNELFMSFGNLNRAFVHYDQHGTSLGTGEVEFERRDEAIASRNKLNGVPLDGKPLHITMINSQNEDSFTSFLRSKTSTSRRPNNNFNSNNNYTQRRFNNNNNNNNNNRNQNISADDLDRDLDEWRMKSEENKNIDEQDEMIDDII